MKKLLSFFLAAVLMLSITACSGDTQNKDSGKDHTGTKTDTVNQSGEAHDSKDPLLTGEKRQLLTISLQNGIRPVEKNMKQACRNGILRTKTP
jgi:hypothetical protein